MANLSALNGAILYAWFPEAQHPHQPGSKYRPVIVVDTDQEQNRLCLAYGTSQRIDAQYRGEITFSPDEIEGLTKTTKFCLHQRRWVPVTAAYFANPKGGDFALIGFVPKGRKLDLYDRIEEITSP